MKDYQLKKLIEKYLDGTATPAERYLVESLLGSLEMDQDEHKDTRSEDEEQQMANRIIANVIHQPSPSSKPKTWGRIAMLAATVLLISTAGLFYFKKLEQAGPQAPAQSFVKYSTGTNQLKRLLLPDSSTIYLNANSSVSVPVTFKNQRERLVYLDGEAFFEVTRDVKRPFKIRVGDLRVQVLGTSFNVSAYKAVREVKVAVSTGKVMVNEQSKNLATLTPGQEIIYNKNTRSFRKVDDLQSNHKATWRDGVIALNEASFEELQNAIYNCYGLELSTKDQNILSQQYNFTVRSSRPASKTLAQLSKMMNRKFRKEGRSVILY
ncbi:FecR domain-containing protein [Pedobacter sp.]|uniref:FecR family protein n=1 Tax=Pedobacter sp. TaxID=1411316 RepID=UPI0031DEAAA0